MIQNPTIFDISLDITINELYERIDRLKQMIVSSPELKEIILNTLITYLQAKPYYRRALFNSMFQDDDFIPIDEFRYKRLEFETVFRDLSRFINDNK